MTITDPAGPLPSTLYGKADWQDYISNWREKDAEWIQERSILRYATAGTRTTDIPSPSAGQTTYNAQTDRLEMWSGTRGAWIGSLMLQYLASAQDTNTNVNISHAAAAGKGANFGPSSVSIDTPTVNIASGMLIATTNNVSLQTPAMKKVTLTTDSDELLSDTPLVAPGIRITSPGTIDATGRNATVGALTASSLALGSGTMSTTGAVTGASFTATGALNGGTLSVTGTGTINGVTFPTSPATSVNASGGFVSQAGYVRGDGDSLLLSYRNPAGGAIGTAILDIDTDYIRVKGGRGIPWHNAAGTHTSWISPVIVSGGDPGAGNFPDGSIWIVP